VGAHMADPGRYRDTVAVASTVINSAVDTLEPSGGTFPRASLSGPGWAPRVQAFGGICGCSHWIEQKEEGGGNSEWEYS